MIRKSFVLVAVVFACMTAGAQTLFTYGSYSVDAKDFLRAFEKNNTNVNANRSQAIKDYLDLYIRSRLKIQEAYSRHYDTLPQLNAEVENLRQQIIDNYMNDPESFNKLVKEAFTRSQKDIHVAHIFISAKKADGTIDTVAAKQKADEAYQRLQKGEDFLKVAEQYSDDPSAKTNKGDIGYITVFSLPYTLENIAYTTAPGKYSSIVRSKAGYHILKNIGERKAIGKIKAQQILLAFPPNATEAYKKELGKRADSLYQLLIKGGDIARLASTFSNDFISSGSGGNMTDFGVGQYELPFENYVFGLPKDGAIGKPFLTKHGYHIVKRVKLLPVVTDAENKNNNLVLKSLVEQSDRMQISKDKLYGRVLGKAGFKKLPYDDAELWALTDSLVDFHALTKKTNLSSDTKLFTIGDQSATVSQWADYAKTFRYKSDGSGYKPYPQVMDEFINNKAQQYYREHLEDFNPDFRNQMTEFKDGNLFFEIMQQEIWNKAQTDSAALEKYYADNKTKYNWKESADAVIFFCSDINISKTVYEQVKKTPSKWKSTVDALSEKVVADSARYEWSQIPNANKAALKAGMVTDAVLNKGDNSASFAYIIKLYPQTQQRSFTEARGLVINDYQNELEEKWITELKKKYPVTINEQVLQSISK
ncbi:MAG: peptidylprolyl isomerase [Chitinophagaceae bacterium]